eukprot:CAMPEP_0181088628 /NCGR_PEP_ID=MMETSP1071-20121207/6885_1 /TAXON_ID=35127 /ORGANISM="Thalassiosira sp., Strain NH16" /LENGTH=124 /DNA_ID=CAMNT_0023170551 /DNA_START=153 /DNA_END=527 /DNA_ORIENTATION=-
MNNIIALLFLLFQQLLPLALAFQGHNVVLGNHRPTLALHDVSDGERDTPIVVENKNSELDDLTPPSISFTRNSILFGDDPPTQRNNGPLRLWQGTKSVLPPLVTGAWDRGRGDKRPMEHLGKGG